MHPPSLPNPLASGARGPTPPAPATQGLPNITGVRGFFYPRWAILAGMLFSVLAVVGYFIKLYYVTHICGLGLLCSPDNWPGAMQISIIWVAYLLLVFVSYITGLGFLETPNPSRHPLAQSLADILRTLSDFGPIHWLLLSFGSIAIVGIGAMIYWNHFNALAFAYCGIIFYIAACTMIFNPRGNRTLTPQERLQANNARTVNPLAVAGTVPGLDHIIPNRVRREDRHPPDPPAPIAVPFPQRQPPSMNPPEPFNPEEIHF